MKARYTLPMLVLIVLLAACGSPATPAAPTQAPQPTQNSQPAVEASPTLPPEIASPAALSPTAAEGTTPPEAETPPAFPSAPLPTDKDAHFAGSGLCTTCHTNMTGIGGIDVSTDRLWKASIMANAARDPYWLATVRSEVILAPELAGIIEDKCASCHMPMSATAAHFAGGQADVLDGGLADPANPAHPLALDGVSCNVCHQVLADNLGETSSFSGAYRIDETTPMGERPSFGPYPVDETNTTIMASVSGFKPKQAEHIRQSEVCATCHTLYTPYLDASGQVAGEFPEQTPYLEWLNSAFPGSLGCNDCHMALIPGDVQLSITGSPPRSGARQHNFIGGNVYMGRIFRTFGEELSMAASSEQVDAMIAATEDFLTSPPPSDSERPQTQHTASLELRQLQVQDGKLTGNVVIRTHTGHKFPTSYPSRRAWLHLAVKDGAGNTVFESGAVAADGTIQGNDNDQDPAAYEPHYLTLSDPAQVQIYEAILGNTEGEVTTDLLRAASYIKDNRLLPAGFDLHQASADIAVNGEAAQDADFIAGGDSLALQIDLAQAQAPFTITAELIYQSIGYRWAQNLGVHSHAEIGDFLRYYDAVPNPGVIVSRDEEQVQP